MTEHPKKPLLVRCDALTARFLSAFLKSNAPHILPQFEGLEGDMKGLRLGARVFDVPVRLGVVVDALHALAREGQETAPEVLIFSEGVLDIVHSVFTRDDGSEPVRLTEKEVGILAYLHAQGGRVVWRAELLMQVWGYVEGVETHTLETHLYRLRQKIEKDPATPQLILSRDDGYCVKPEG